VDHMQAPQQQCHAAHQIEENHASHARQLPAKFGSKGRAIAKLRPINPFVLKELETGTHLHAESRPPALRHFEQKARGASKRSLKAIVQLRAVPLARFQRLFATADEETS
jgi:hypothetical protein